MLLPVLVVSCGRNTGSSGEEPAGVQEIPVKPAAALPADTTVLLDAVSGATAVANPPAFNGTLVMPPQSQSTITLSMDGTVRKTELLPGDYVEKGEILAILENPDFINLQQAYLESQAQTEFLRAEYLRQRTLALEKAASQKKFQQSKSDYLSAKSRMEAAAAHLLILGVDTSALTVNGIVPYIEVRSPMDGYVSEMYMNVGKHFTAGTPLCEIIDKNAVMVRLTAYEKDLARLIPGTPLKFSVNGMEGKEFHAQIVSVGQRVDASSRSVEVYARIKERSALFRPGMYVTAGIMQK